MGFVGALSEADGCIPCAGAGLRAAAGSVPTGARGPKGAAAGGSGHPPGRCPPLTAQPHPAFSASWQRESPYFSRKAQSGSSSAAWAKFLL